MVSSFWHIFKRELTVTFIMLAAVIFIVNENRSFSIGTSYVFQGWTFIGNYLNSIVSDTFGHGAVAILKGLILL